MISFWTEMKVMICKFWYEKIIILSLTYFFLFSLSLIKHCSIHWKYSSCSSTFRGGGGGSMLGDVNISAILDSFSVSYDKRVRPNYGGKTPNQAFIRLFFFFFFLFLILHRENCEQQKLVIKIFEIEIWRFQMTRRKDGRTFITFYFLLTMVWWNVEASIHNS